MPMTTTAAPGTNLVDSAVAGKVALLMLADRGSLRGHPALVDLTQVIGGGFGKAGGGSLTGSVGILGLDGSSVMTDAAEGYGVAETSIDSAKATVTIGKKALKHAVSDELASIDPTGSMNATRLGQNMVGAYNGTFVEEVAGLATGFSRDAGTSGSPFDHDMFLAAQALLTEEHVPGPYLAVLDSHHYAEWVTDLESRTGVTQWRPATAEQQVLRGENYKGNYNGVDIFITSRAPTSGSDAVSMMFGRGAIGYAEQELVPQPGTVVLVSAGPLLVEARRNDNGTTSVIGWAMLGVIEVEDLRGCKITALGA